MRNWLAVYRKWWARLSNSQRWQYLAVSIATLFGAAYRLFNLPNSLQFLADQGRDAIIAHGILHGDFTLVGPSTSVGEMYLGPIYYYFMAPFLWLASGSPLGPAYAVAIIGVITVPLLFMVGRRLVGPTAATLATLLYAFAPYVNLYTRFSWNPNPAPIVTLGMLYAGWKAWHGSPKWWIGVALGWAVMIQLHYVAMLIAAPFGILLLADFIRSYRAFKIDQPNRARSLLISSLSGLAIILLSFLPLVLFNLRFNGVIAKGFTDFFAGTTATGSENFLISERLIAFVKEHHGRAMHIFFEIWGQEWGSLYRSLNTALLCVYAGTAFLGWHWSKKHHYQFGFWLLLLACLTTISGLAWYRSTVHHHYLTYFFPISYLVTGAILVWLRTYLKLPGLLLASSLLIYISWLQVQPKQLEYLDTLGWPISKMEAVAQTVLREIPTEQSYSLAALTEIKDYRGLNYRYFLINSSHPPVAQENVSDADWLVIIAENPREADKVINSPVYEISSFPKGEYKIVDFPGGPLIYLVAKQP